ncbi:MAG: SpoIIE family protein phosphatase [Chloroflexota bacterium]
MRSKIYLADHLLDELKGGTVFGEMALIDAQPRSASAIANKDSKLIRIDETRFAELASQHPQFGLAVMRVMSIRTRRLIKEEISRQRMVEELAIGREIQLGLLPDTVPKIKGWEFAAVYLTATQVGGDIYDFILDEASPNHVELLVADVTGKGVPAALFMASMRSTLRTLAREEDNPTTILRLANRAIMEDIRSPLFLSCIFGRLNTLTGEIKLANGGHDWPLWSKASENQVETLEMPGFVLGMFKDIELEERSVKLSPGDALVIFTDGVTEARNKQGEFFDDERLVAVIKDNQGKSAAEIADAIVESVKAFSANHPRSDDLTLMVIKRDSV